MRAHKERDKDKKRRVVGIFVQNLFTTKIRTCIQSIDIDVILEIGCNVSSSSQMGNDKILRHI